jgi:hypothetical protein
MKGVHFVVLTRSGVGRKKPDPAQTSEEAVRYCENLEYMPGKLGKCVEYDMPRNFSEEKVRLRRL